LKLKKKFANLSILFLCIFLLNGCNNTERYQHIEVFVSETLEKNDEGIYEKTGFKKINAITIVEEDKNHVATDIKSIEDFYDIEGNYLKTEIKHSEYKRSKVTNVEDGGERKKELQEPSTLLIPVGKIEPFQVDHLTEEEKEEVKNHILSFIDKL